eukprot:7380588-Prymnesium_polylepis.2
MRTHTHWRQGRGSPRTARTRCRLSPRAGAASRQSGDKRGGRHQGARQDAHHAARHGRPDQEGDCRDEARQAAARRQPDRGACVALQDLHRARARHGRRAAR